MKMVLPVRVWARDAANKPVLELAHTLDITPNGARLGAVRHQVKAGDKLTLQYHQRKIQFRVVWVAPVQGKAEFQVGLQTIGGGETWGLELSGCLKPDDYGKEAVPVSQPSNGD
jgi:ribosomal 50S subunit-recycling heat shock protein